MKIQLKGNRKLCILGAVVMMILVVEAVVLIALTIAYGQEYKKTKLQDSAEVQNVLSEIENEEGKLVYEHLVKWSRGEDSVETSAKP